MSAIVGRRRRIIAIATTVGLVEAMIGAGTGRAADRTWIDGSGSWQDPSQWSGGVVPINGDSATVFLSSPATVSFSSGDYPLPGLNSLNLDGIGSLGFPTLDQSGGTLSAATINVGIAGPGAVSLSGGLLQARAINVGGSSSSTGNISISGGTLAGAFLYVGSTAGAVGTLSLSNTGYVNVNSVDVESNGHIDMIDGVLYCYPLFVKGSIKQSGGLVDPEGTTVGTTATYNITSGTLASEGVTSIYGTVNQSGGLVYAHVGPGGTDLRVMGGVYNLSAGTLNSIGAYNTGSIEVGGSGGLMNQSGGTITTGFASIGGASSGAGTYRMIGSTLNSAIGVSVGTNSSSLGGSLWSIDSGATASTDRLSIYNTGSVYLNASTLTVGSINLMGAGSLNFRSGTLNITGSGGLGVIAGGPVGSQVSLSAGKALIVDAATNLAPGTSLTIKGGIFSTGTLIGTGGFVLNSGLFRVTASDLQIGSGVLGSTFQVKSSARVEVTGTGKAVVSPGALLQMSGGSLSANGGIDNQGRISGRGAFVAPSGLTNEASITFNGGDADVFGNLTNSAAARVLVSGSHATFHNDVMNQPGSQFQIAQSGTAEFLGSLTGNGAITGAGTAIFDGSAVPGPLVATGTAVVASTGSLATPVLRDRALVLAGPATITAKAVNNDPSGTSVVQSLTFNGGPAAPTAALDLMNNSMIIDYSGASPVDVVRQLIRSGATTGYGIISSLSNARAMLGYADNKTSGFTSFAGLAVDPSSVVIKFTLPGDANLDGKVDAADLSALTRHWRKAGPWTSGDFNYDGFVDAADLAVLTSNWSSGVSASAISPTSGGMISMNLLVTSVPEPSGIILMTSLLSLVPLRRRR